MPLLSNSCFSDSPFSDCHVSCRNAPFLRLLVPSSYRCVIIFSVYGEFPELTCAPPARACKPVVTSSSILVGADSSTMSSHSLSAARWKSRLIASRPPVRESFRGLHRISPCFPDVAPMSCFVPWSRCRVSWQVLYYYVPCAVPERYGGTIVPGCYQLLPGITIALAPFLRLSAATYRSTPLPISVIRCSEKFPLLPLR
jgi:hypothetical protein